jgi:Iap family predicted aminopeptidase
MSQIHVTIKTQDGGTLTLSADPDGWILGRREPSNGKSGAVHTMRLEEKDMADLPSFIWAIGKLL